MYFKQFLAIFKNSFKICLSDSFFLVINLAMIVVMGIAASMPSIGSEHLRLIRDQTHAILFLCGAVAVSFGMVRVVTDDLRRGAGSVLMSRPVSGMVLISGKFFGVLGAMLIFFISGGSALTWMTEIFHEPELVNVTSLMILISLVIGALAVGAVRQYLFGSNFCHYSVLFLGFFLFAGVTIRYFTGVAEEFDLIGLQSVLLLYLALVTFAAVILVIAVLNDSAMVIGFAVFIFFFGLVSEYLFSRVISGVIGDVCSVILPNFQLFWVLEKIGTGEVLNNGFFLFSMLHVVMFSMVYLIMATIFFDRIEIKGSV